MGINEVIEEGGQLGKFIQEIEPKLEILSLTSLCSRAMYG